MRPGLLLSGLAVMLAATSACAGDLVAVESRTVVVGATEVAAGVFIENDIPLSAFAIPLEFRTVTGGAFIDGSFTFDYSSPSGRIPFWYCQCGDFDYRHYYSEPLPSNSCSGPRGHTWSGGALLPNADGSPDAVLWTCLVCMYPAIPPGADAATPSLVLTFDVNESIGEFEIDTCCVSPSTHLAFTGEAAQEIVPAFAKGVIAIVCDCAGQGDIAGDDGIINVLDVAALVDHVFRGGSSLPTDPYCPSLNRGDVDCDQILDVLDVVHVVNVAFRGAASLSEFCNPCLP